MTPPPSLTLLSSKAKMTPQLSHCQLQNVISYSNDDNSYEPYPHDRSDDNTSLNNNDEEECSLLHHLFAPPGSDDNEDGQPSASNLDAAAPNNPYEHPGCGNELYLDPSKEAMLDMMVLLDSSGTQCSLYNNLLMLMRKHSKKGFDVTKAKGRE
jgi:hypothetical protein